MRIRLIATLVTMSIAGAGILVAAPAQAADPIAFEVIGRYSSGLGELSAEIAQADGNRLYSINTADKSLDIIDFTDPANPTRLQRIDLSPFGGGVNSVAVKDGLVAVAVEGQAKTDTGAGVFFDRDGRFIAKVDLGALPDMVAFSPNGLDAVFANEGEPNDEYTIDPPGSVSIVRVFFFRLAAKLGWPRLPGWTGIAPRAAQLAVQQVTFDAFNVGRPRNRELPAGVRIFGPNAVVAQNLEPEYVTFSHDGRFAFVSLQENNAVAEIDLLFSRVRAIRALPLKDHSLLENALDANDDDGTINIAQWPVKGMYQPDAITSLRVGGDEYLVTANEGDVRDWDGFSELERIEDFTLDPTAFPNAAELQTDEGLNRLRATTTSPQGPNGYTELWTFGARSFSIWRASDLSLVYDSGDDFEQKTAELNDDFFNVSNDNNEFDDRSDDKGPEPEGVAVGTIGGRSYAFVGLERVGGLMIYDVTDPTAPLFVQYDNTRDFNVDPTETDSGPEGVQFLSADRSPTGQPLILVSHEVSGSVLVYAVAS